MSSARVESPLLQGFRRQPFSQAVRPGAARMPRSRACRQLFPIPPVDREETDRYLEDKLAEIMEEDRGKLGLDLDTFKPLPASDEDDVRRYTDWEAVPKDTVPEFYHEVPVKHKPQHPRFIRPTPFFEPTSPQSPPSIEGISNASETLPTVSNDTPSTPYRTDQSQSPPYFRSLNFPSSSQDARALSDPALSRSWPEDATSRRLTKSASTGGFSESRDCTESSRRSSNTRRSRSLSSVTSSSGCPLTQRKLTDYMRQRKRHGSGSSASSESSSDADGEKHHHVPAKRRHAARSTVSASPAVEGNS